MAHLFLRFQAPHGRLGPGLRLELTKGFCQVFCGTRVTHASNKPPFVKLTWFPRNICHGLLTMFTSQSFGFTPLGGGRPCQRLARPRPCLTCPSQRDRRLVRGPLKSNKSTKRRSQRRWGSSSLNVDPTNMAGSAHQAASSRLIADHTHRLPGGKPVPLRPPPSLCRICKWCTATCDWSACEAWQNDAACWPRKNH